jgi:hypothetical protein
LHYSSLVKKNQSLGSLQAHFCCQRNAHNDPAAMQAAKSKPDAFAYFPSLFSVCTPHQIRMIEV